MLVLGCCRSDLGSRHGLVDGAPESDDAVQDNEDIAIAAQKHDSSASTDCPAPTTIDPVITQEKALPDAPKSLPENDNEDTKQMKSAPALDKDFKAFDPFDEHNRVPSLQRAASQVLANAASPIPNLPANLRALKDFVVAKYNNNIDMVEEDIRQLRQMDGSAVQLATQKKLVRTLTAGAARSGTTSFETAAEDGKNQETVKQKASAQQDMSKRLEALKESTPSKALQIDITNPGNLYNQYDLVKILRDGVFGHVSQANVRLTKAPRAVKTINKRSVQSLSAETWKLMCKEIEVCKMVDHPNVIRLYEIFDDSHNLHLVTELCTGGYLIDYIRTAGIEESQACVVMMQIFRGVRYLHENMICHRDLQPNNILLASKAAKNGSACLKHQVRVGNFEVACVFKENQVLKAVCGTPGYMAPEVSGGQYNYLCDVWSCGAIMWRLLGGLWPCSLSRKMLETMPGPGWKDGRSKEAQQLCQRLLSPEPNRRISLRSALGHEWFDKYEVCQTDYVHLNDTIVQNLRSFRGLNKFKKAALKVIASLLSEDEIKAPRDAFLQLDSDGSGTVSMAELRDTLFRSKKAGMNGNDIDAAVAAIFFTPQASNKDNEDLKKEIKTFHKRHSWRADKSMPDFTYTEFLAATFDRKYISEELCNVAFQCFDKDCDGTLGKEELVLGRLLGQMGPDEREQLVEDLDINGDGEIDIHEFCAMMKDNAGWHTAFKGTGRSSIITDEKFETIIQTLSEK